MRALILLALITAASAKKAVIGFDIGTESVRAGLFDATSGELLATKSHPHETRFPQPGYAEQSPAAWWAGMGEACRAVVAECSDADVVAICLAATSCTVVACDDDGAPLRDCLLWMDQRAAAESDEILRLGDGDAALNVNAQGKGPISAEWMLPKALWLKKHEREIYDKADVICECQDWLNHKCTDIWVAGGCNVATRWHCDGKAACEEVENGRFGGRPSELLRRCGLEALEEKWPRTCVAMGQPAGALTAAAAQHLGLKEGTPVSQGGADAFVGLVGLGTATRGGVGVITGSSSLHLAVAPAPPKGPPKGAPGVWGPYRGAPLSDLAMSEGGQSTTGAALQWARRIFGGDVSFDDLEAEAAALPVGAEGCAALETFQGARTPETDPKARGALYGLTLKHGRGHIWRALLEATALGTRASVDALTQNGPKEDLALSGGATRSKLWLQMHADACGRDVVVCVAIKFHDGVKVDEGP
jgi:ribulose kinase